VRTRSIAAALLVTFAPCALVRVQPAYAQDEATTVDARARFLEGVELFDKAQYEKARAKFLQAYALKKHPDVLLNLATSCLKANHSAEAERYFQQFLREDGKDAAAPKRAQAEKGLADARAKLGRIEVTATAGTEVTVDNDRIGVAPLAEPVYVEPGAHTVKFKGADGTSDSQNVTVVVGQSVAAQFGKAAAPAAVPVPPAATPAPASPATPEAPPSAAPAPSNGASGNLDLNVNRDSGPEKKSNLLTPPKNMVPVYIGGGIAAAGFLTALFVGVIAKNSAQDNATEVENKIKAEAARDGRASASGICNSPSSADQARYGKACAALRDNQDAIDTDAMVGNIALGVGAAAAVGTVAYYLLATKKGEGATARPVLMPSVGPQYGGLSVVGSF
jgi:hypothetical protein